jgi:hypothetical protein
MKVLGLVGNMGVGKDTIAEILRVKHNWIVAALADELKRTTGLIFDLPMHVMFGESKLRATRDDRVFTNEYWAECEDRILANKQRILNLFPPKHQEEAWIALYRELSHFASNREKCTARYFLQRMGTEWGRSVYVNVWVDALGVTISNLKTGRFGYSREYGLSLDDIPDYPVDVPVGVAVTDCRFDNEIWATHHWGGKAIWVDASGRVKPSGDTHASEPTYENFKALVDGKIDNNGSPTDLEHAVDSLVQDKEFWA